MLTLARLSKLNDIHNEICKLAIMLTVNVIIPAVAKAHSPRNGPIKNKYSILPLTNSDNKTVVTNVPPYQ